jgi:hypothetical protein
MSGCNSLELVPNKTDYFGSAMESKGNKLESENVPLSQRIANLINNDSNVDLGKNITFEVALDQFSIMPLLSVDRFGGVIITDWFINSSDTNERVKFNIIIKDEMMSNESIDIIMFKETLNNNNWTPSPTNTNTTMQIKEVILKKAKRLKATAELS